MSSVTITVGSKKGPAVFLLTEEHERSAVSGSPVLVGASGGAFNPYDCPFETGEGLTARAIASYALNSRAISCPPPRHPPPISIRVVGGGRRDKQFSLKPDR